MALVYQLKLQPRDLYQQQLIKFDYFNSVCWATKFIMFQIGKEDKVSYIRRTFNHQEEDCLGPWDTTATCRQFPTIVHKKSEKSVRGIQPALKTEVRQKIHRNYKNQLNLLYKEVCKAKAQASKQNRQASIRYSENRRNSRQKISQLSQKTITNFNGLRTVGNFNRIKKPKMISNLRVIETQPSEIVVSKISTKVEKNMKQKISTLLEMERRVFKIMEKTKIY